MNMTRPREIDAILEKIERLIVIFGLKMPIGQGVIKEDFNKLCEYIRKLEKGF